MSLSPPDVEPQDSQGRELSDIGSAENDNGPKGITFKIRCQIPFSLATF